MPPEIRVVVALTDEFDEGVDGHQRIFNLVGDPRDHAREELGLLDLTLLRQELLLRRQVFEDENRAERRAVLAAHGISRDLEPEPAQRELDLVAARRASRPQRVEEHVAQRRRKRAEVLLEDLAGRELENLLGPAVDRADALIAPDGDDAARHVGQDALAELLLTLELIVERDVADGRGQVRREIEERLGLAASIHRADDRLPDGEDRDELTVG